MYMCMRGMCVHVYGWYVSTCVCMHACMYACACMHKCVYKYTCSYMHINMQSILTHLPSVLLRTDPHDRMIQLTEPKLQV